MIWMILTDCWYVVREGNFNGVSRKWMLTFGSALFWGWKHVHYLFTSWWP